MAASGGTKSLGCSRLGVVVTERGTGTAACASEQQLGWRLARRLAALPLLAKRETE
jgi:hypothetical protein